MSVEEKKTCSNVAVIKGVMYTDTRISCTLHDCHEEISLCNCNDQCVTVRSAVAQTLTRGFFGTLWYKYQT